MYTSSPWLRYGISAAAVLAVLLFREALQPLLAGHAPMLLFTLAVMLAARFGGFGPALAATALSAVAGWYFLFEPRDSFALKNATDHANVALFVLVGSGLSLLGGQLRRSLQTTEAAAEQLHALSAALLSAQQEERRRIARELHDDLTQRLCAQAIDLGRVAATPNLSRPDLLHELHLLQQRAVESAELARHMAHDLHPSILDDLGLQAALRAHCEEFSRRQGIPVDLDCTNLPPSLSREICACLYAVTRESLQNIARHAQARRIRVALQYLRNALVLTVVDDGVGFAVHPSSRLGLGIVSMRERVRALQGVFAVDSHPGQGTRVSAQIPL